MNKELSNLTELSLSEIRERLEKLGITLAMSSLHEIISKGDVTEQLQKRKVGNRTLYPVATVAILADAILKIRADSRLTMDSLPDVMRQIISKEHSEALSVIRETPKNAELVKYGDNALEILSEIRELLKERIEPPTDKLLSMKEAHSETGLPYAILKGIRVKVGNRLYVRRLDALRAVQEAKKA